MEKFTKYEVARILGARGLQIAMDAPLLVKLSKEQLEKVKYDPIEIARIELESDVLPITIKRPFPKKIERKLSREKEKAEKYEEKKGKKEKKVEDTHAELQDKKAEAGAKAEEKDIKEEGEIMEIVQPEDEVEETGGEAEEGVE
jgi:DNA-directed RNA polymerase subunit K